MASMPKNVATSSSGRVGPLPGAVTRRQVAHDEAGAATLARGLRLLETFQQVPRPLTHGELANLSGLTPPTVTRIASALEKLGYLKRRSDRRWELTADILSLGHPKLAGSRLRRFAHPYLLEIAHLGGVSLAIAEPSDFSMVFVDTCTVSAGALVRLDVGERRGMAHSAVGHAYLLALADELRADRIASLKSRHRRDWKAISRRIDNAAKDLEARGFIYSDPDAGGNDYVVAAPLVIPDEEVRVVLCAAPPFAVSKTRMIEEMGPRLVALCRHLEELA